MIEPSTNSTIEWMTLCGWTIDADARHFDVEKPARFDHLETFVEKRGGIDRDFAAHDPRGMFEGARDGDLRRIRIWVYCGTGRRKR